MTRSQYFLRSALHVASPKICPYCQSRTHKVVDSKYLVTTLNECADCQLLYRHPLDSVAFNQKFYQDDYEQPDGITTDLPGDDALAAMKASDFSGTGRDFSGKIHLLKQLLDTEAPGVIDYGANWGYTSYQFKQAGFTVQSFEISKPRAQFGRKLGLDIATSTDQLEGEVDLFFNSHVIEHLPDIKYMFNLAKKLLKPSGLFTAYCPNGSMALRKKNPNLFRHFWGQVHPNCLSAEFFATAFKNVPYLIGSDAVEQLQLMSWDGKSQQMLDTSGNELFVFAKIKNQSFD